MKLRDSINIRASAQQIWPHISDPVLMAEWNPKISNIKRNSNGPVHLGESFSMTFTMSSKPRESTVDVIECQEPYHLVLRHKHIDMLLHYMDVSFQLTGIDEHSRLIQIMDFSHSGIPLIFQILIWITHKIGKPTGKPYLQILKEKIENAS
jgi:hypothetical protein